MVGNYYRQLTSAGVRTHAHLLALTDERLRGCGVAALGHRKLLLARIETLKLLPSPDDGLQEWMSGGSAFASLQEGGQRTGARAGLHSMLGEVAGVSVILYIATEVSGVGGATGCARCPGRWLRAGARLWLHVVTEVSHAGGNERGPAAGRRSPAISGI